MMLRLPVEPGKFARPLYGNQDGFRLEWSEKGEMYRHSLMHTARRSTISFMNLNLTYFRVTNDNPNYQSTCDKHLRRNYQQSHVPVGYFTVLFLVSTSKTTHKVPRTDEKSLIILPSDTTSLSTALNQSRRMLWLLLASMALWDDIYTKLKQGGIPLSDTSNQGAGGILNEHIQDDRSRSTANENNLDHLRNGIQ